MSIVTNKKMRKQWLAWIFSCIFIVVSKRLAIIGTHLGFACTLGVLALLVSPASAQGTTAPTISPPAGLYFPGPTVTMTAPSGTIYYTLDGTQPNSSSTVYSPYITLSINGTTTIKAIAINDGVSSDIATSTLVVDPTIRPVQQALPNFWVRSDAGVTADTSNKISSWFDNSSYVSTATQSTTDAQPSLVAGDYNGIPAVALGSGTFFNLPSGFAYLYEPNIFFVTKPSGASSGVLMDLGNGSVSDNIQVSTDDTSTTFTINDGSTPGSVTASSAFNLGQYHLLNMNQAAGIGYISVDGVQQASGTLGSPNDLTRTENHIGTDYSGAANFYNGNLLEAIVVPNGVGLDAVETYLLTRYQLLNVTPAAPVISVPTSTLEAPTQVAVATPANCICYITTDGSTPSSESPVYNGPINIYYSQTLKSIAISNSISSDVSTATYTLDSSRWPAPDGSDTRPLQLNVQSPTN